MDNKSKRPPQAGQKTVVDAVCTHPRLLQQHHHHHHRKQGNTLAWATRRRRAAFGGRAKPRSPAQVDGREGHGAVQEFGIRARCVSSRARSGRESASAGLSNGSGFKVTNIQTRRHPPQWLPPPKRRRRLGRTTMAKYTGEMQAEPPPRRRSLLKSRARPGVQMPLGKGPGSTVETRRAGCRTMRCTTA